jgi:type VI protein secretion system component Hcp
MSDEIKQGVETTEAQTTALSNEGSGNVTGEAEQSSAPSAELAENALDNVVGGVQDMHFTKVVDGASPNLFISTAGK